MRPAGLRGRREGRRTLATDIEQFIGQPGREDALQEVRKQIDAEGV